MGKKKEVTIGYAYYMGIHMGISRGPVDEMVEIKVGDRTAWRGSRTESGTLQIEAGNLFGGKYGEGGVRGPLEIMMGESDQVAPPGLTRMHGGQLPGYRGMFTAFFNGVVTAMNPYPKRWAFRVRRTVSGWQGGNAWYPEGASIWMGDGQIKAMNPAHIIYECLTNSEWGRGLETSFIDSASFRDAADKLIDEGFGLCFRWSRTDEINTFIQAVVDHVGGSLYTDRSSGLVVLKLIRGDYDASSLPLYTMETGLLEISEATIAANTSTVNQVIVEFTDPIENETRMVRTSSVAAIQAAGGAVNSQTKRYAGCPTADLALLLAQRDLQSMSFPLRRFRLTFDRTAWRINPGDVFRISNPVRGLGDLVLRAGRVEDGTLSNGRIEVTAVQDVFALPLSSFTGVAPPIWQPPQLLPDLKEHHIIEVPYFLLSMIMDKANFDYIDFDSGFLGTLVSKPTPLSTNYDIGVREGLPDPEDWPE